MPRVESIIDPSFKSGEKNNKKWTLVKVLVDGKTATGFGPVSIGDEVDLSYNEQYKNYGFKKLGPQDIPTIQLEAPPEGSMKLLELIYDDTQKILKLLDKTGYQKAKETAQSIKGEAVGDTRNQDTVVDVDPDEPVDLSAIPF